MGKTLALWSQLLTRGRLWMRAETRLPAFVGNAETGELSHGLSVLVTHLPTHNGAQPRDSTGKHYSRNDRNDTTNRAGAPPQAFLAFIPDSDLASSRQQYRSWAWAFPCNPTEL